MQNELNVMVVDDTVLYRHILSAAVKEIPGCSVMATAGNGAVALTKMANQQPDLVLLDCEMPVMGGLETLTEIRKRYPRVVVAMVSGINQNAAAVTFEALNRGAIEFIPKPEGATAEASQRLLAERLRHVCGVAHTLLDNKSSSTGSKGGARGNAPVLPSATGEVSRPRAAAPARIEAVVIGVSTGGPNALGQLLPGLPRNLGVPVLIVQHMPAYFTACLAKSLGKVSPLPVVEAQEGLPVQPNQIYVAPGGHHMVLRREGSQTRIALNTDAPVRNCRPSVDVLFHSVASVYGDRALAVVMTGMGDDGCDGVRALRAKGARCLTQSRDTCVIYGMPRAVAEAGLSDEVVALDQLASRIAELTQNKRNAA